MGQGLEKDRVLPGCFATPTWVQNKSEKPRRNQRNQRNWGGDVKVDAVFEGGGVKGIGFVGAVSEIEKSGHEFESLAGTSAGTIVADATCEI
jgi:predicted acylesterase/phospholipase RssA